MGQIQIRCPLCGSWKVSTNSSRSRKNRRVKGFICKNHKCKNGNCKTPKQFILTTSYEFKELIFDNLKRLYKDLIKDGAKNKTNAKKYNLSESQISRLCSTFESVLDKHNGLDKLVKVSQPDRAIVIDETFLKIEDTSIYIIISIGYKTHKTLGLKVSKTRTEKDMWEVFDETERNTKDMSSTVISDG